ncbi:MAG: TonB-dependent receptor plug domain-containing protein [Verrucomicrobiales bacterium]
MKTLPPVVVTATREMRSILEQPNSVVALDAEKFLETQARTLPEALLETPGILVQRTGPAQGSPFVRGFTGYRNLALIDGIRLNNSVFREGPNQYWGTIDPYGLAGIELVKGQGSVLYGSDAIGGTLNALTLRPTYQADTSKVSTLSAAAPLPDGLPLRTASWAGWKPLIAKKTDSASSSVRV